MSYIENPKTKGSGIYCTIPQEYQKCKRNCSDCFFQNGRSYLEPLTENLPNIPPKEIIDNFVIRVNDGLDSGENVEHVIETTRDWPNKFYNTSWFNEFVYRKLYEYGPIVLTINPGSMTDEDVFIPITNFKRFFMAVRFRANMWNQKLLRLAIDHWTTIDVPVIITFMRYYSRPKEFDNYREYYHFSSVMWKRRYNHEYYIYKDHILNPSWSINEAGWHELKTLFFNNPLVFTCGAGPDKPLCKDCGVCLQLYWRSKDERKNKNL